jgi:hypothetical protein
MGENMNRLLLFLLLLVVISIPMAFADYNVEQGQPITFYVPVTNGEALTSATGVNISISHANGTIYMNSTAMVLNATGEYFYTLNATQTGNYIATVRAVVSGTPYSRDIAFSVVEDRQMILAITITLLFMSLFFIYVGKDMYTKPMSSIPEFARATKWLDLKKWGVLFVSLSAWSLVVLIGILTTASYNASYNGMMQTIFFVTIAVMGLFTILYVAYFFIFAFYESLEKIRKIR